MALDFDISTLLEQVGFNAKDYQYFHQLLDNRTILFNTYIDEDIVEKIYLPLKEFENDTSVEPVTLILNSPGGSVADGFFLAHYIAQYKKQLNIIVLGYAASMSAVILAAGGKNNNVHRMCYPSTYALVHDGYITMESSESKTAQDFMAFNDKVDNDIKDFIVKNTNITAELYESKTRHQWFISAKEMKELNLIDEIIGSEE